MVATTRLVAGSIFVTVPSPVFGTQTAPAPTAAMAGRWPTPTIARAGPEAVAEADGETLDPEGAQPAITPIRRRVGMLPSRARSLVNIDLGHEVATAGRRHVPLVDDHELQGGIPCFVESHRPHQSRVSGRVRNLGQHLLAARPVSACVVDRLRDRLEKEVGGIEGLQPYAAGVPAVCLPIGGVKGSRLLGLCRIGARD